jgi:hypothetical protein
LKFAVAHELTLQQIPKGWKCSKANQFVFHQQTTLEEALKIQSPSKFDHPIQQNFKKTGISIQEYQLLYHLIENEPNSKAMLMTKLKISQKLWNNQNMNRANQQKMTFHELIQKDNSFPHSKISMILFQLMFGELMQEDSDMEIHFLTFFQNSFSDLGLIHFLDFSMNL